MIEAGSSFSLLSPLEAAPFFTVLFRPVVLPDPAAAAAAAGAFTGTFVLDSGVLGFTVVAVAFLVDAAVEEEDDEDDEDEDADESDDFESFESFEFLESLESLEFFESFASFFESFESFESFGSTWFGSKICLIFSSGWPLIIDATLAQPKCNRDLMSM